MRTQWTTKGNRDAGSSWSCDRGLHRYLRNFGGVWTPPLSTPLVATNEQYNYRERSSSFFDMPVQAQRGIAPNPFPTLVLESSGWWAACSGRITTGNGPVPISQKTGWAMGLVWMGMKNPALIGIQSLDCPSCSGLLYWLCCPSHP